MLSEYSKRMSEGAGDYETVSLEMINELFEAKDEWNNIQDIVSLTFRAVYSMLKAHDDSIKDIEQALPQKANKADV